MSARAATRIAWLMWTLSMLLVAVPVPLYVSIPASRPSGITDVPDAVGAVLFTTLVLIAFPRWARSSPHADPKTRSAGFYSPRGLPLEP